MRIKLTTITPARMPMPMESPQLFFIAKRRRTMFPKHVPIARPMRRSVDTLKKISAFLSNVKLLPELLPDLHQIALGDHQIVLAHRAVLTVEELAVELDTVRLGGQQIDRGLLGLEVVVEKVEVLHQGTGESLEELGPNVGDGSVGRLGARPTKLKGRLRILRLGVGRLALDEHRVGEDFDVNYATGLTDTIVLKSHLIGESREDSLERLTDIDCAPIGAIGDGVDFFDGLRKNGFNHRDEIFE